MNTDKPMDPAAVLAAAERIVADGVQKNGPGLHPGLLLGHGARIYHGGIGWTLSVREHPPGTFVYTWVPDPSSPA